MKKTNSDTVLTIFYVLQMRKLKANKHELFVYGPSIKKITHLSDYIVHDSESMLPLHFTNLP